jgi:hypothetical protein
MKLQLRILFSVGLLALVFTASFLLCSFYVCINRRIAIAELNGGHHIYVQYGDVFSADEVINPSERRNIVISVNRCFDTKVDDDLVSSGTLHGIAMKNLYSSGRFTETSLNTAIQGNLARQAVKPDLVLTKSEKRSGNLKRYPVGTIAEIDGGDNCTYFFLGLSKFDHDLKATTSDDEYVLGMMRLLEYCDTRSQQFPIVMPLIGGGLSRTNKAETAILEYIVSLIKMNEPLVHCDIHIVVRDSGKESIAITGF